MKASALRLVFSSSFCLIAAGLFSGCSNEAPAPPPPAGAAAAAAPAPAATAAPAAVKGTGPGSSAATDSTLQPH